MSVLGPKQPNHHVDNPGGIGRLDVQARFCGIMSWFPLKMRRIWAKTNTGLDVKQVFMKLTPLIAASGFGLLACEVLILLGMYRTCAIGVATGCVAFYAANHFDGQVCKCDYSWPNTCSVCRARRRALYTSSLDKGQLKWTAPIPKEPQATRSEPESQATRSKPLPVETCKHK